MPARKHVKQSVRPWVCGEDSLDVCAQRDIGSLPLPLHQVDQIERVTRLDLRRPAAFLERCVTCPGRAAARGGRPGRQAEIRTRRLFVVLSSKSSVLATEPSDLTMRLS